MRYLPTLLGLVLIIFPCAGCIDINLPQEGLLGGGPFVLKGEAGSIENDGACLVWVGIDGRMFLLFQTARLSNEDFDAVTTPGTPSRLELSPRSELGEQCRSDAIAAEVTQILEIDGVSQQAAFRLGQKINEIEGNLDAIVNQAQARLTEFSDNAKGRVNEVVDGI